MRRIVIAVILSLAVVEPIVMYHSLMREREQRQQAFAQSQGSTPVNDSPDGTGR